MYAIVFHAHQKLDRVARRHLRRLTPEISFPTSRQILHFEAGHGPDGTRLKRQTDDQQPWHFIDPDDVTDTDLHGQIQMHYDGLVGALRKHDDIRAAFEAAWLAHALVDGLTPAHHYPYEQALEEIRGQERQTRKGLIGRAYVKGEGVLNSLQQSIKVVGPKGLLTTHALFEAGAYIIIAPMKLTRGLPSQRELSRVQAEGVVTIFKELTREIAALNIYDRYYSWGWTHSVVRDIRREMAPRMVKMITLAWYAAVKEAAA